MRSAVASIQSTFIDMRSALSRRNSFRHKGVNKNKPNIVQDKPTVASFVKLQLLLQETRSFARWIVHTCFRRTITRVFQ